MKSQSSSEMSCVCFSISLTWTNALKLDMTFVFKKKNKHTYNIAVEIFAFSSFSLVSFNLSMIFSTFFFLLLFQYPSTYELKKIWVWIIVFISVHKLAPYDI